MSGTIKVTDKYGDVHFEASFYNLEERKRLSAHINNTFYAKNMTVLITFDPYGDNDED